MADSTQGSVVSLTINPGSRQPLDSVEQASFVTGHGIEGDRHYTDRENRAGYQVLLMDRETIEALGLSIGDVRENVTTDGIDLATLKPDQLVGIGSEVVLRVFKDCPPCGRMDELRPGLRSELLGRRGMLASVERGGSASVGDAVRVLQAAQTE
jgi:MOSC domain-containing protein YiiM